jgi:hypothetical protein
MKTDISFVYDIIQSRIKALEEESKIYSFMDEYNEIAQSCDYAAYELEEVVSEIKNFVKNLNNIFDNKPKC